MSKSKTWKQNRDERRQISQGGDTVELHELDALLKGLSWTRGWADNHHGAQIGIVYLIRDGIDECAVVEWPAYAGWGDRGTQVPRTALQEARALIENPPPPRLRTVSELQGQIEAQKYRLGVFEEPPGRYGKDPRCPEYAAECQLEIARLQRLIEERSA